MSSSLLFSFFKKTIALIFIMFFLTTTFAFAGVLQLISGKSVEGKIILRNEELVKIDTGSGIPITYYLDEISTINGKSVAPVEDQVETVEKIEAPRITEQPAETIKAPESIAVSVTPETAKPVKTTEIPEKKKVDVKVLLDKDVATLDDVAVSKKEHPSPLTIKPKKRPSIKKLPDIAKNKEPEEVKTQTTSVDRMKEIGKTIFQKAGHFIKTQMQHLETAKVSLQKKLPAIKEKLHAIPMQVRQDLLSIFAIFLGVTYIFTCFPLMKIAKKLDRKWTWLIWVPIIQIFYFIRMADKPLWRIIFLLVPILNFFVVLFLFLSILRLLKKSFLLIIPILIPGMNILALWYLALSKTGKTPETRPVLRKTE